MCAYGTIHLRRRQIFRIFDSYPPPINYPLANLINFWPLKLPLWGGYMFEIKSNIESINKPWQVVVAIVIMIEQQPSLRCLQRKHLWISSALTGCMMLIELQTRMQASSFDFAFSTGKSFSEVLIYSSFNPQYDNRLFNDLQVELDKNLSKAIVLVIRPKRFKQSLRLHQNRTKIFLYFCP